MLLCRRAGMAKSRRPASALSQSPCNSLVEPCRNDTMPGLHHAGDRARHVVDVALVQRGDADAARIDAVDAELAAQALHLVDRQPAVAEHAALLLDERHVPPNPGLA